MTAEDMILQEIRRELQKNAAEQYRQSIQRFFKEEIKLFGVKTPLVRKISQKYFSFLDTDELPLRVFKKDVSF